MGRAESVRISRFQHRNIFPSSLLHSLSNHPGLVCCSGRRGAPARALPCYRRRHNKQAFARPSPLRLDRCSPSESEELRGRSDHHGTRAPPREENLLAAVCFVAGPGWRHVPVGRAQ